jgi:hypothetical protein
MRCAVVLLLLLPSCQQKRLTGGQMLLAAWEVTKEREK